MRDEPTLFDFGTLEPSLAATAPDNWIINDIELANTLNNWAEQHRNQ